VPKSELPNLKIAVASSGLGHIRRGVETWAEDTGAALHRRGLDVTTFRGGDPSAVEWEQAVPCMRRFDSSTARIVKFFRPFGGWRYGVGSGYSVEQTTFALNLWRKLGQTHDILHVQDPQVAVIFERLHRMKLSRPRVILGHGTEEEASILQRLSYLQHLAPNYMDDWETHRPVDQLHFAIPNFVDTKRFSPGGRESARAALALPADALVFVSVGALKKFHKRVDYLIREFGAWRKTYSGQAILLIAGARESETDEILALRTQVDPESIRIMENVSRERIIDLLRAADAFTLASLHEMMPIAVLEALSCGLPVACNDDPTLRWMVGGAGRVSDISQAGALGAQFGLLSDPGARSVMARAAREQAESLFSEEVVVNKVVDMYRTVARARLQQ
jgi:1,2-diacylglycerol 3-alpha-glucosyltransferase